MKRFLSIATAIACIPSAADAQLSEMRAGQATRYGVELTRGLYEGDGLAWYTSTVRGRVLTPLSASARLLVDAGLSLAGVGGGGMDGTFTNPELGVVFVDEDNEARAHFTVVLPIGFGFGDDDASVGTGFLTDLHRPDRYFDELFSVNAGITPRASVGASTSLTSELTAAALIPRNDGDAELFARYGIGLRHDANVVRLSSRLEGFAIVSQGNLSFGERTLHRVVLSAERPQSGPGFFVQVPLDEDLQGIDAVVGFTFVF
jgi:hypothetical protein